MPSPQPDLKWHKYRRRMVNFAATLARHGSSQDASPNVVQRDRLLSTHSPRYRCGDHVGTYGYGIRSDDFLNDSQMCYSLGTPCWWLLRSTCLKVNANTEWMCSSEDGSCGRQHTQQKLLSQQTDGAGYPQSHRVELSHPAPAPRPPGRSEEL
jgi:hypothetical protein